MAEQPAANLCPICYGTLVRPAALPCGHVFCLSCIDTAVHNQPRCPVCRIWALPQNIIRLFLEGGVVSSDATSGHWRPRTPRPAYNQLDDNVSAQPFSDTSSSSQRSSSENGGGNNNSDDLLLATMINRDEQLEADEILAMQIQLEEDDEYFEKSVPRARTVTATERTAHQQPNPQADFEFSEFQRLQKRLFQLDQQMRTNDSGDDAVVSDDHHQPSEDQKRLERWINCLRFVAEDLRAGRITDYQELMLWLGGDLSYL